MKNHKQQIRRQINPAAKTSAQAGFGVITYVLLAVVLLAALTAALSRGSNESAVDSRIDQAREELYSQAMYVESVIQDCTIRNGFIGGGSNPGFPVGNDVPINASPGVPALQCPNTGDSIWVGSWFQPKPIVGFGDWRYLNNPDGVSIRIPLSDPNNDRFVNGVIDVTLRGRLGNPNPENCTDVKACRCGSTFVYFLTRRGNVASHCS